MQPLWTHRVSRISFFRHHTKSVQSLWCQLRCLTPCLTLNPWEQCCFKSFSHLNNIRKRSIPVALPVQELCTIFFEILHLDQNSGQASFPYLIRAEALQSQWRSQKVCFWLFYRLIELKMNILNDLAEQIWTKLSSWPSCWSFKALWRKGWIREKLQDMGVMFSFFILRSKDIWCQ